MERWITRKAATDELIAALQEATQPLVRQTLCVILWERCETEAVPVITDCLRDPSPQVRDVAADALNHLGDRRAGPVLLAHFIQFEQSPVSRTMLAFALGSVDYRPAIPWLIAALTDPQYPVRLAAAFSLGTLGAWEAEDALRKALTHEGVPAVRVDIESALETLRLVAAAEAGPDVEASIVALAAALDSESAQVRAAAVRALGHFQSPEIPGLLARALAREVVCSVRQRLQEALAHLQAQNSSRS